MKRTITTDGGYFETFMNTLTGKEVTPSRREAEEKALSFFTGQIVEEASKKAHITQAELARRIGTGQGLYFKSRKRKNRTPCFFFS